MKTNDIVLIGMFAALLAVISQISLPTPSGVAISVQVFGIALVGVVLGWRRGFFTTVVYILLGAAGLPVFANFRGGIQVLAGVSGGYIMAWPVMVLFCGIRPKLANAMGAFAAMAALSVAGLMIVELAGAWHWSRLASDKSLTALVAYSFIAFIPKDIIITILAIVVGNRMRRPLETAGYLR